MSRNALYNERVGEKIKCNLCPHYCLISNTKSGLCGVRTNQNNILKTINYGKVTAMANDPIEKKPLYHFHPGKDILSVGSFGCNFTCDFCQNYSISQYKALNDYVAPDTLIKKCLDLGDRTIGLAFTYNEPSIWYEYIYDTVKQAKESHPHLKMVLITNGYINPEPLKILLPYIDAMNIDLKAFNQAYYQDICGGDLDPVLKTIELASKNCHVEVTTLLVNGLNDSLEEVRQIASFLSQLDKDIPLHLSRYFPRYHMTQPATDIATMEKAKEVALEFLNHVYLGNIY